MNPYSIEKTPSDVLEVLAQKVKLLRKERKMSQAELARRSKVSLGSYKRFETTGHISLDSLLRIAFILGRLEEFEGLFKANEYKKLEALFLE